MILQVHPVTECSAIILASYAAFLGFKRTQGLHFHKPVRFKRDLHAIVGAVSLITVLCGIAAAKIIVSRYMDHGVTIATGIHGKAAMIALPFMIFSLFSGFYLYLNPGKRRVLPLLHGLNNLLLLLFFLFQIFTGGGVLYSLPAG